MHLCGLLKVQTAEETHSVQKIVFQCYILYQEVNVIAVLINLLQYFLQRSGHYIDLSAHYLSFIQAGH